MIDKDIANIKNKLNGTLEWTEEEEENIGYFGFLAGTCYQYILNNFKTNCKLIDYHTLSNLKSIQRVKEYLTTESVKFPIDIDSSSGKKFTKALSFILNFQNVPFNFALYKQSVTLAAMTINIIE